MNFSITCCYIPPSQFRSPRPNRLSHRRCFYIFGIVFHSSTFLVFKTFANNEYCGSGETKSAAEFSPLITVQQNLLSHPSVNSCLGKLFLPHPYLAPVNFVLYLPKGWLVPFCLAVQYLYLTPPDLHCLPDLSGEAIPGGGSHLGLELGCCSLVHLLLVFLDK